MVEITKEHKKVNRITWAHPYKSLEKAQLKLEADLKFCGAGGAGDCAMLDERRPQIVAKEHKDGSVWWHIMVDNIPLPLSYK